MRRFFFGFFINVIILAKSLAQFYNLFVVGWEMGVEPGWIYKTG